MKLDYITDTYSELATGKHYYNWSAVMTEVLYHISKIIGLIGAYGQVLLWAALTAFLVVLTVVIYSYKR